jgi:hypothetical protein
MTGRAGAVVIGIAVAIEVVSGGEVLGGDTPVSPLFT